MTCNTLGYGCLNQTTADPLSKEYLARCEILYVVFVLETKTMVHIEHTTYRLRLRLNQIQTGYPFGESYKFFGLPISKPHHLLKYQPDTPYEEPFDLALGQMVAVVMHHPVVFTLNHSFCTLTHKAHITPTARSGVICIQTLSGNISVDIGARTKIQKRKCTVFQTEIDGTIIYMVHCM